MAHDLNAVFYADYYHPIQAGSIDGTDTAPHDNAVYRAMLATSTGLYDPMGDPKAQGDPHCIVFVGRLARETIEATIEEVMSKFGKIKNIRLVRDIVTGASQGYAFVEYETEKEMRRAYEAAHQIRMDGRPVLVDYNRQLLMPGWIPRRLGGGLGGRKESGQLRFGGRDRPFRKPLRPIPQEELEKLGIPLPGRYMSRFENPPLPKRKSDMCNKRKSSQHDEEEMSHHSYGSTKREKTIEKVTLEERDSERRHKSHARGSDTYSEVDKKRHHKRHERKEEGDKEHRHHHYRSDKYQHEEDDRWGHRSHATRKSSHKEVYEEDALERHEKRKVHQTSEEMKYHHSYEEDTAIHEEEDKEDQLERREKKTYHRKGDDVSYHGKKHEKRREHRSEKKETKESAHLYKDDEQEEFKTASYEKHGRKTDCHKKDDRKHNHNWDGSKDYEDNEPSEHEYSYQEDAVAEGVSHSNRQHKRRWSSKVNKSLSEDDHSEQDVKTMRKERKRHRSRRSLSREQLTKEKPFCENDPSFKTS